MLYLRIYRETFYLQHFTIVYIYVLTIVIITLLLQKTSLNLTFYILRRLTYLCNAYNTIQFLQTYIKKGPIIELLPYIWLRFKQFICLPDNNSFAVIKITIKTTIVYCYIVMVYPLSSRTCITIKKQVHTLKIKPARVS